ncbi:MAG: peptidylprolyl isomerase [Nitrospira sp.]|nr:peptidylprolyl isomerase [Nitrospira sp.]
MRDSSSRASRAVRAGIRDNSGLDRRYTVFGEIFRGIEVLDKIVAAARDAADNPIEPITMTVTVKE